MSKKELYRKIPKIDKMMETEEVQKMVRRFGHHKTTEAARAVAEEIRGQIDAMSDTDTSKEGEILEMLSDLPVWMEKILKTGESRRMRRVINGTGVILHTNLGRAPMPKSVMEHISEMMCGYMNLEYELQKGSRGSRYDHFSDVLCRLTGAEAAIAVNNNAAAVLLMLSALTKGGEVVISRGELIEIGGKFRVPEVMEQSGAKLVEVGTTNRTYAEDYERVVTQETAAFLKVHTSNYKILGFTHQPEIRELSELGRKYQIPVLVDLGSGSMVSLEHQKFARENQVKEVLAQGADLVCFSGDKLLGGPQAGIIVGRRDLVEKISCHPLMRAMRIDRFTAAAMDAILSLYEQSDDVYEEIPVLEMLGRPMEKLKGSAEALQKSIEEKAHGKAETEIKVTTARAGGGAMPQEDLPSICLAIAPLETSTRELERRLRDHKVPVIGRIEDDALLLDMRTIFPEEITELSEILPGVLLN